MTQPEDTSDDFRFLIEGSYKIEDDKRADGECCKNCAFDVSNVCIKREFAIFDDNQWCSKYIKTR